MRFLDTYTINTGTIMRCSVGDLTCKAVVTFRPGSDCKSSRSNTSGAADGCSAGLSCGGSSLGWQPLGLGALQNGGCGSGCKPVAAKEKPVLPTCRASQGNLLVIMEHAHTVLAAHQCFPDLPESTLPQNSSWSGSKLPMIST
jgi:hypothetical protein